MKKYVTYGVRLPVDASARIDSEAERTGIQKSVLLRSIVMGWIEKERDPATSAELGGTTLAAGGQLLINGVVAGV